MPKGIPHRKTPPKPEPQYRKYPIGFCAWCFTELERKILEQTLRTPAHKDLAAVLNLSVRTIKFYNSQIIAKFGVDNMTEVLAYLLRLNLCPVVHAPKAIHRRKRNRAYLPKYTRSERAEHEKARQHRYYVENKEKVLAKNRVWREKNKKIRKEQDHRYYLNHKKEIYARVREWKKRKRLNRAGNEPCIPPA